MTQTFVLANEIRRQKALEAVSSAQTGSRVRIADPKRTDAQSDRFHAICTDAAKSGHEWMGKKRTKAQWKVLFVSGHAIATGEGADMTPGLEGEFVNLRESTAEMSVKRGASLIDYSTAFCIGHGITLHDPQFEEMT